MPLKTSLIVNNAKTVLITFIYRDKFYLYILGEFEIGLSMFATPYSVTLSTTRKEIETLYALNCSKEMINNLLTACVFSMFS